MHIGFGIKTGLVAAVTLVVLSWINFYATKGMSPVVAQAGSIVAIAIASLWMLRAMRHSRDIKGGGRISFWGAFFSGMQVGVIEAIGMFISTLVFMMVSSAQYRNWSLEEGIDAENVVVMAPAEQAVIMFLIVLFVSTVMALILAIGVSSSGRGNSDQPI